MINLKDFVSRSLNDIDNNNADFFLSSKIIEYIDLLNSQPIIYINKISEDVCEPTRAHDTDSGLDLYVNSIKTLYGNVSEKFVLMAGQRVLVGTGLKAVVRDPLQRNWEIQVRPRSGLAWKNGLSINNCIGTIDHSYTGEIGVNIINHGHENVLIEKGMKICQAVIAQVLIPDVKYVPFLLDTVRGEKGHGSSGT